jgi:hypothetical protein
MQKRDRPHVDIGHWLKHRVGDIGVSKVRWNVASDIFLYGILTDDPYPTDLDKVFTESFK